MAHSSIVGPISPSESTCSSQEDRYLTPVSLDRLAEDSRNLTHGVRGVPKRLCERVEVVVRRVELDARVRAARADENGESACHTQSISQALVQIHRSNADYVDTP